MLDFYKDYEVAILTTSEAGIFLGRDVYTIRRYIRGGFLKAKKIKNRWGTLEYRISNIELEKFLDKHAGEKLNKLKQHYAKRIS